MKKFILTIFLSIFLSIQPARAISSNISVLYTADDNFINFALISLNSILLNNNSNSKYTFYFSENGLSEKNKARVEKFVKKRNQEIVFVNVKSPIMDIENIYNNPVCPYITNIGMARLFASDFLPKDLDRVIYLDSDTLVLSDMKELWETNLEGRIAGLVDNINIPDYKNLYKFKNGYYNTGVIVFDLEKCRREKSSKQFLDYYFANIDKFTYSKNSEKHFFCLIDQDLLNVVWDGKIKPLDFKWNQQTWHKTSDTGILHYIGNENKPWNFLNITPKVKEYYKYWDKTSGIKIYKYYYYLKYVYLKYTEYVDLRIRTLRFTFDSAKNKLSNLK